MRSAIWHPYVPTLRCTDQLPQPPRRILIEGSPGGGKSTLARAIARALQIRYVEMDALAHGPKWTMRPSFQADVAELASKSSWVTEWQFDQVRDILTAGADLMVWLDLPRSTVMRQLGVRTLSRQIRRTELEAGNTEPPLHTVLTEPNHMLRWAWRIHHQPALRMAALSVERPTLPIVRLTSNADKREWLAKLAQNPRHD
ncbi:AAA family ATPase [Ornithinimicrobium sp. Arc0846-15]|nr:AAA family ATPase [Ornithinimicrobium laminariae]